MRVGWAGKVALGAVIPALAGMGAFALVEIRHVRKATLEQVHDQLRGAAVALAHAFEGADLRSAELPARIAKLGNLTGDRITVIDAAGTVVADSVADSETVDNHGMRPEVVEARAKGTAVVTRSSRTLDREFVYAAAVVPGGMAVARVARALELVEAAQARATGSFWLAALVAGALSVGAAALIARSLARPVEDLRAAAAAVEEGDLAARVRPSGGDDVAELGHAFNRMTTRLRETVGAAEAETARLTTLLDGMTEGVVAVDAEERISFVNGAAREILGVPPEREIEGVRLYEVVRDPHLLGVVQAAAVRRGPVEAEIVQEGPPRRTIHVHAAPVGKESADTILVLRDLSVLRRLERVRSDFVSNVSHELRTPLAAIAAAVETLRDAETRRDDEAGTRFVEMIQRNVSRLEALINDILALSRLESRPDTLQRVPVDLAALVRGAEEEMQQRARTAKIALAFNGDARVPVLGDARTLRRIVDNLVVNAITYTQAGGKVAVRVFREGKDAVFQVMDTGIGIPRTEQVRIFERFYRVDKARSRSAGGTGLGLAIVKHAIGLHGGSIAVESEPGRGSTFTARIPAMEDGPRGDS